MLVNRLKILVLISFLALQAGCAARETEKKIAPPTWEPDKVQLSPTPDIQLGSTEPKPPMPEPFTGIELASELAQLSSEGAAEIARLKTEVDVETDFPVTAAAMLEQTTQILKDIATEGYHPLEVAIADDYALYSKEAGKVEDNIKLGESMQYVLGRDVAGYYQMNSTQLKDLKKAYWNAELERLNEKLAGMRTRFRFAVETRLLGQSAQISARQRDVIDRLDNDFIELAEEYARRVNEAITEAASKAGFGDRLPMLKDAGFAERYGKFDSEFKNRFDKAKAIAGGA